MEKKGKWDAQNRSRSKIYEMIQIKSRREFCLNSRLDKAAKAKGISKNAYILCTLEAALSDDRYGRDMLDIDTQD